MRATPHPTALILAGGRGMRLASEVPDLPKAMAPVAGRPFAEWLVASLRREGVARIVFCTGYRADAIEGHFGDGAGFGVKIRYSREETPLGTAGALRLAAADAATDAEGTAAGDTTLLALNGDSFCRFDLSRLEEVHAARRAKATLWTVPVDDASRYGSVAALPDGRVEGFVEKSAARGPARINAGVYLFDRDVLLAIRAARSVSLETEVLPGLVGRGLWAATGDGPFLDIGTPESYLDAGRFFAAKESAISPAASEGASR